MRGRIYKRFKNSWQIVLSIGRDPETGRRKQKWISVKGTKAQAEKKLTELLYERDGGASLDPTKLTFNEYLALWLPDEKKLRLRSRERYQGIIDRHIKHTIGTVALDKLNINLIQRHYTELLNSGLAPSTVRRHHALIHHALKDAITRGYIRINPADSVELPRKVKPEFQIWDVDELNKFLQAIRGHYLYTLFYLALFTGMRRSELLGLEWKDVDLLGCQLSVRRGLHYSPPDKYYFSEPKSELSKRSIALSPLTVSALRSHWEACKHRGKDDRVFMPDDKPYFNHNTVSWQWRKACIAADVTPIRFHDSRHTHATLLLKQGVHPKVVQERLGHSSIQITLDLYSHIVPGLQESAAKGFDNLITDVSGFVAVSR